MGDSYTTTRDPNAQGYQGYQGQNPSAQGQAASTAVANTNPNAASQYKGKVGANWSTYQTQLSDLYKKYLGRDPGEVDYQAHAGSPNYSTLYSTIYNSPEARQYATTQREQAQGATYANPTATPVQGDGTVPPPTVPIAAAPAPAPSQSDLLKQSQEVSQRQPQQGMPNYSYLSDMYRNMIANPAFSPQVVSQMKEVQKEQQASMLDQFLQQMGQRYASQGRYGAGAQGAAEDQARADAASNILSAFRGIDIDTAGKNVLQQLQAGTGLASLDLGQIGAQDQALNNILNWARFFDQGALARGALGLQGAQLEGNLQNALMQLLFNPNIGA